MTRQNMFNSIQWVRIKGDSNDFEKILGVYEDEILGVDEDVVMKG